MEMRTILPTALLLTALLLAGCGKDEADSPRPAPGEQPPAEADAPKRILVDQILISFKDSPQERLRHPRTLEEAKKLAESLYARIRGGVSFRQLQAKYTDARQKTGRPEAAFVACNKGVPARPTEKVFHLAYTQMWPGWAEVIFRLQPGEVGFVPYDKKRAGDGYYIVARIQ